MATDLKVKLATTYDLRKRLIETWDGIQSKEVSISEGRAKALIAREILNTIKTEMMAARVGLTRFTPVDFDPAPPLTIEHEGKKR